MTDITLTGTVVDSDGTPWANARVDLVLVGFASPQGTPKRISDGTKIPLVVTTFLDNSGNLSVVLAANNNIVPFGTSWVAFVSPNVSTPAQQIAAKIYNANASVSADWNAQIEAPRISGKGVRAYNTTEIVGQNLVDTYVNTSPATQGTYMWNGSAWVPLGTGAAGFDVSGTPANRSNVPVYNGGSFETAVWRQLTQTDILPAFAVTGFSGGQTVEIGAAITNPSFGFSYTAAPASATLTNMDGIDSPFAVPSPFTTATLTGTFHHTTQSATGFTINAVDGSGDNASAGAAFVWLPRNFVGVGAAGATDATASGNTAILTGAAGTLNDAGLSGNVIGTTFAVQSPSAQKIYVLTTTLVTVWHDATTGFALPFNAPTTINFTNQNGAVVSMRLYESTNVLSGTFEPQAVS